MKLVDVRGEMISLIDRLKPNRLLEIERVLIEDFQSYF